MGKRWIALDGAAKHPRRGDRRAAAPPTICNRPPRGTRFAQNAGAVSSTAPDVCNAQQMPKLAGARTAPSSRRATAAGAAPMRKRHGASRGQVLAQPRPPRPSASAPATRLNEQSDRHRSRRRAAAPARSACLPGQLRPAGRSPRSAPGLALSLLRGAFAFSGDRKPAAASSDACFAFVRRSMSEHANGAPASCRGAVVGRPTQPGRHRLCPTAAAASASVAPLLHCYLRPSDGWPAPGQPGSGAEDSAWRARSAYRQGRVGSTAATAASTKPEQ